jgi:hypothetical protein
MCIILLTSLLSLNTIHVFMGNVFNSCWSSCYLCLNANRCGLKIAMLYLVLYMIWDLLHKAWVVKHPCFHGGRFSAQTLDAQSIKMLKALDDCHVIWVWLATCENTLCGRIYIGGMRHNQDLCRWYHVYRASSSKAWQDTQGIDTHSIGAWNISMIMSISDAYMNNYL